MKNRTNPKKTQKKENSKQESPEIYSIHKDNDKFSLSRKDFLATLGTIGAGLALLPQEVFGEKIENLGQDLAAFKSHTGQINAVCLSPDGKLAASVGSEKQIKFWSMPEGDLLKSISEPILAGKAIRFSPDGLIFAALEGSTIRFWSIPDYKLLFTLNNNNKKIYSISFSPDGKTFAAGGEGEILFWSVPKFKFIMSLDGENKIPVKALCFNKEGNKIAYGSGKDIVELTVPFGLNGIQAHSSNIETITYSLDGNSLITGSLDKTIKVWSLPDFTQLKIFEGHNNEITSVQISPDGKFLASASSDKTIRVWSLLDGSEHKRLEGHTNKVGAVCYSPDGSMLVSGDDDGMLRLWLLPDGKPNYVIFDPSITEKSKARKIKQMGFATLTLPCGSPIPSGAKCICDCIASSHSFTGTEKVCICNTVTVPYETKLSKDMICVCNTVVVGTYTKPKTNNSRKTYYSRPTYYTTTYWYPN